MERRREPARALERERRPRVVVVPEDHRREQDERQDRAEPRLGPAQLRTGARVEQREGQRAQPEQRDRVLGEQPEADAEPGGEPRARLFLDQRAVQKVERARPGRGERRVGSHHRPAREGERQRGAQRERRGRGRLAEPATREREGEARRDERAEQRGEPHRPLVLAEQRRRARDQPGDERRVVEIGEREVLRVAPVVRLLGQELERAQVRGAQREEIRREREAAHPQRDRALGPARGREHEPPRGQPEHRHADGEGGDERGERRQARARERLEHAPAQERRQEHEPREPRPRRHSGIGRLARNEQVACAQREGAGERRRRARELRRRQARAHADEEREHERIGERAQGQRRAEAPHARRVELAAGERRQPPQVLARRAEAELRLAARAVDEHDRLLDDAEPTAAVRENLEQDLEALRRVAEREQLVASGREEPRQGIARARDRPGQRRREARRELPAQRPARRRAARHAAAADRDARAPLDHRARQRRHHLHRVRQVGVHHHDHVGPRRARARDHRAGESARPAPLDQAHRVPLRPGAHARVRAVGRCVVDDDHLEGPELRAEREDLLEQRIDVVGLVQGRHHDRERGSRADALAGGGHSGGRSLAAARVDSSPAVPGLTLSAV